MENISFNLNGKKTTVNMEPNTPMLWILREHLGLTGTKYGCGKAICGSCTIHLDSNPVRACITPISAFKGKEITTIEGLSEDGSHPLQQAWIAEQVPQCGYCQSGQIMQAAALLEYNTAPTRGEIISHMKDNLCRCGTYSRIIKAIEKATLTSSYEK